MTLQAQMREQPRVVLSHIACEVGTSSPLRALGELGVDAETLEVLEIAGLESFWRSSEPTCDIAARSVEKTLASAGLRGADIDAVFFATESTWDGDGEHPRERYRAFRRQAMRVLNDCGLRHAYPIGVMFSGCSNLVTAITLASDALFAGRYRKALVVVADRLPATHSRILPPGIAVVSDGAASCVVSLGDAPGFRVEGAVGHADMAAWSMDLECDFDKFGGYLINLGKQLLQVKKKLSDASGVAAEQYRYLVMNNYSRSTIRLFSTQLGFASKQVMTANLPTHAHVNAVDLLLNLNTLEEQGDLREGDRVMALASATATWGAMSLTYTGKA